MTAGMGRAAGVPGTRRRKRVIVRVSGVIPMRRDGSLGRMGMAGVRFVQAAVVKVNRVLTMRGCRSRQSRTRGEDRHERTHKPPAKSQLHSRMRHAKLRRVKNPGPQHCQFVNASRP